MTMEIKERAVFGDVCYEAEHPSGLRIFVLPKKDYASTYALFGAAYGSIDTTFRRSDEADEVTVPEGIAHYLEHKLFESEQGDAFARYAKTGANANAFTSFDKTCYLFSCSDHFYESFDILLDFVQSPYFTPQTVQKEQGIIGQEIGMYDDDPDWCVLFNLLGALYHEHPVRINIAGTVESIAKIDADLLYRCYRTFYDPANMALCVAGNVQPQEVFAFVEDRIRPAGGFEVCRRFPEEPKGIVRAKVEQRLSVSVPLFQLGFKETAERRRTSRELVETDILLELLAGEASSLYRRLLDAGLINAAFGYEYLEGPGYASVLFGGESKDPDRVAEEIRREAVRLREEGIAPGDFEWARRTVYGRQIALLGNVEAVANQMMECAFSGRAIGEAAQAAAGARPEDIERRLREQLDPAYSALSVVLPQEEE